MGTRAAGGGVEGLRAMLGERRVVDEAPEEGIPGAATVPRPHAREYRCSGCGYGAILRPALPVCPMCGGVSWETARSPLPPRFAD